MFESELKFRVNEKAGKDLERRLLAFNPVSVMQFKYIDSYYDNKENSLKSSEKELRIRKKFDLNGELNGVTLTFKESPFDMQSRSKAEHEVSVDDGEKVELILGYLGFEKRIGFVKYCELYEFDFRSFQVTATLVRIDGIRDNFLELEIMTENLDDTGKTLFILKELAVQMGLQEANITNEYYTDLMMRSG